MPTMTPTEAAKRSGLSRRTVMRAITKGLLIASRTNIGWVMEEPDYEAWACAHGLRMRIKDHALPTHPPTPGTALLKERIQGLETLLAEMRAANDDLRAERDAWRAMTKRSWWRRLTGEFK